MTGRDRRRAVTGWDRRRVVAWLSRLGPRLRGWTAEARLRAGDAVERVERSQTRAGRLGRRALTLARVPTRLGWGVAGIGLSAWLAGRSFVWRELVIVAVGCAVALAVAAGFTLGKAILRIDLTAEPPRLVVGKTTTITVTVTNVFGRRLVPLRIELPVGGEPDWFLVPALAPDAFHPHTSHLRTARRGVLAVGPASSVRGDPLGLMRRSVAWTGTLEVLVHPHTVAVGSLGAGLRRDLEGQATNDLSMNDVAFHALRQYQPGDDRRHIHWATTARTRQLMVRQFVDTRTSHVAILISGASREYRSEEEFELAVSVGGSLGLSAVRDKQAVSLLAAGHSIAVATGTHLLDQLSRARFGAPHSDLASLAEHATRGATDISVAALVVGGPLALADIRGAAARFGPDVRVLAVQVSAAAEPAKRRVGQLTVVTVPTLADLPAALGDGTR